MSFLGRPQEWESEERTARHRQRPAKITLHCNENSDEGLGTKRRQLTVYSLSTATWNFWMHCSSGSVLRPWKLARRACSESAQRDLTTKCSFRCWEQIFNDLAARFIGRAARGVAKREPRLLLLPPLLRLVLLIYVISLPSLLLIIYSLSLAPRPQTPPVFTPLTTLHLILQNY
jgi:hypothetical protein